jgi:phosphoribosylanthranilate isomerase
MTKVLLTNLNTPHQIINFVEMTGVDTLQVQNPISIEALNFIKARIPNLKIIKTISAAEKIDLNRDLIDLYKNNVDAFLVDSSCEGGSGISFDPSIALEIMSFSNIPVILAGGINSNNINNILQVINPFGIDVESGVEGQVSFGRITRKYTSILKILELQSAINTLPE